MGIGESLDRAEARRCIAQEKDPKAGIRPVIDLARLGMNVLFTERARSEGEQDAAADFDELSHRYLGVLELIIRKPRLYSLNRPRIEGALAELDTAIELDAPETIELADQIMRVDKLSYVPTKAVMLIKLMMGDVINAPGVADLHELVTTERWPSS